MPPPNLVKPATKSPTRLSLINLVIDWIVFLNGFSASVPNDVLNGNLQQYTGSNNIPDNWVFTAYTGGSGAIDTTTQPEGTNSFAISIPGGTGNGGGYLESFVSGVGGALVPFSASEDFWASWYYKTSSATTTNLVEVRWFDSSKAFISASTLWSASSGQSTTWIQNVGHVASGSIPGTAKYFALRFTGGSVNSIAGTTWYAGIKSAFIPRLQGKSTVITSTGTFTVPSSNAFRISVKVFGASGNGAVSLGGGGGGAGYSEGLANVSPGQTVSVTIGAVGSTTSCSGFSVTSGANASGATGGAGGVGSGGDVNVTGQAGQNGTASGAGAGGQGVFGGPDGGHGSANAGGAQAGVQGRVLITY